MANKAPAFQFYPKDFLSDLNVATMTNEQLGIYIKLLCHCWLENGLPDDKELIMSLVNGSEKDVEHVLNRCFILLNCVHHNPRLIAEREKQDSYRQAKSKAGKASAEARKSKVKSPKINGKEQPSTDVELRCDSVATDFNSSSASSSAYCLKEKEEKEKDSLLVPGSSSHLKDDEEDFEMPELEKPFP